MVFKEGREDFIKTINRGPLKEIFFAKNAWSKKNKLE